MNSLFQKNLAEQITLLQTLTPLESVVGKAASLFAQSLQSIGKLMFCGNGGSASECQYFAAELTGRSIKDRRQLAAIALSRYTSAITCISIDYSFDEVFARQVQGRGRASDVFLAISTLGSSRNIIRAVEEARAAGMSVIGLIGRERGALNELCDVAIVVPSQVTTRIHEPHVLIDHTLCGIIEQQLGLV